jgi:hypothetical protein
MDSTPLRTTLDDDMCEQKSEYIQLTIGFVQRPERTQLCQQAKCGRKCALEIIVPQIEIGENCQVTDQPAQGRGELVPG